MPRVSFSIAISRWSVAFAALLVAGLVASCGGDGKSDKAGDTQAGTDQQKTEAKDGKKKGQDDSPKRKPKGCQDVPPALVSTIEGGIKDKKAKEPPTGIENAQAARSKEQPAKAPPSFQRGLYFVSARLKGREATATWAVDADALDTGKGVIVPVNPAAENTSKFDTKVKANDLGLDEKSDGFKESRECSTAEAP